MALWGRSAAVCFLLAASLMPFPYLHFYGFFLYQARLLPVLVALVMCEISAFRTVGLTRRVNSSEVFKFVWLTVEKGFAPSTDPWFFVNHCHGIIMM